MSAPNGLSLVSFQWVDGWALQLLAATNWWLWVGGARWMWHLPRGTGNRVCAGAVGGGGAAAHITASTGGRGASKGAMGARGHARTNTLAASPGGGYDGTNTLAASPGRVGDGTNTLVQPHYPTPTKSVNRAGPRGGRLGTTIKGKHVGGIAKRCEQR